MEASLADQPGDEFLRYALAMQCIHDGDVEVGRLGLLALIADNPDSIAAYQQLGQSYAESDEADEAREILARGIRRARALGDHHAASEMEAIHEGLEGIG
ncbi:MAG: hypothetical protein U0800_21020 [Isosphaeraceae bacterium]